MSQSKGVNNKCNAKIFWQYELVGEMSYNCPTYNSDVGLYIAGGDYTRFLNGQVRNFFYIKN